LIWIAPAGAFSHAADAPRARHSVSFPTPAIPSITQTEGQAARQSRSLDRVEQRTEIQLAAGEMRQGPRSQRV